MHSIVARQLHEYKVYLLVLVSKAYPHSVTHNTFPKLLLSPFTVHEIIEFDISIWIKHFCLREISEISFWRLWGLNRGNWLQQFRRLQARTFRLVPCIALDSVPFHPKNSVFSEKPFFWLTFLNWLFRKDYLTDFFEKVSQIVLSCINFPWAVRVGHIRNGENTKDCSLSRSLYCRVTVWR